MDKFILDTDTCIYWLKGNENIERSIIRYGLGNIFITVITECELFYGAYKSVKKDKNLAIVEELKTRIKTLHTVSGIPSLYGKIKAELESKGQVLDDADLLIGSIALVNNAALVTNNIEHFKRISGLKIENWR
ncbi:MAG TPA: type II toxin-antitoxin system VapC family toxin [Thermodesulfovibrionales bacterium]|nr:type II toxin-antitoxin system VapC family toxin [Thermodesulfovibrionales bacterium]